MTLSDEVMNAVSESVEFTIDLMKAIMKYCRQDWGNISERYKKLNDRAYKYKNDVIMASYDTVEGKIYIVSDLKERRPRILFGNDI